MNTGEIVLASINGRTKLDNDRLQAQYLTEELMAALKVLTTTATDAITPEQITEARKCVEQFQLHMQSAESFDELVNWLPTGCRFFQTRSQTARSGDEDDIHMYVEIDFKLTMPGDKEPGFLSIPVTGKHLLVKITPEECQDFITMRHADRYLTDEELHLLIRLAAVDRFSQLKLWELGYPVHAGYNHALEHIPQVNIHGLEEIDIRLNIRYTTQQDKVLLYAFDSMGNAMFHSAAGRCVPDHSCCAKGVWPDAVRREYMQETPSRQDWMQQKDLLGRMRDLHAAQQKK